MAINNNTSDIAPVLTTAFGAELSRLWNRKANFLSMGVTVGPENGLKQVFWAASAPSTQPAKTVSEGYQLVSGDSNADSMIPLALSRGIYLDAFTLSDTEMAVARNSPLGPVALVDMVAERVFECATRVTDKVDHDLIAGPTSGTDPVTSQNCIVGLDGCIITTGTYAGQNVASISGLQGNVFGNQASPAAFTIAQMTADFAAINLRSNEKVKQIWMHPWVGTAVQNVYENERRIVNMDGPLQKYNVGPSDAFEGAQSGLTFLGRPILYSQHCYINGTPGDGYGTIYYTSPNHLELDILRYQNPMDGSAWEHSSFISSGGGADDTDDVGGPALSVISMARTGLAATFAVAVELQMKNKRPLALGKRVGVSF